MKVKNTYIQDLIAQGEHRELDFKFEISDSKKIARTLVAFANTSGGRILIGVKDNGNIAGIRSEEEQFMIESASEMYSKPPVPYRIKPHAAEGKAILEVIIPQGKDKPYKALAEDKKWMAYVRVKDQTLLANSVMLDVWDMLKRKQSVEVKYREEQSFLLQQLKSEGQSSIQQFMRGAKVPYSLAKKILSELIALKIISIMMDEKNLRYCLFRPELETNYFFF